MRYLMAFMMLACFSKLQASEFLKFINQTGNVFIICNNDIEDVDSLNNIITLNQKVAIKLKEFSEDGIVKSYFFNIKNDEWQTLKMTDVRSATREKPYNYILLNKGNLFVFNNNILAYEGKFINNLIIND